VKEKISACITACNEERKISRCLESVVPFSDEIVVVDSFSVDRTVEICKRYTDRVYQHEWLGYVGQKNLIKDMAAGPWIFFIDADEEVSPTLCKEIRDLFESGRSRSYDGFEFPRRVHFLGKWIMHGEWYPDLKLRLFRKDKGDCVGREPHDRVVVHGNTVRLKGPLYHFTYNDIMDQIQTLNRFSSIAAQGMCEEGRRFRMHDLLFRPMVRFVKGYIFKLGFLDGVQGWIIAIASSFFVFLKYAKLWERRHASGSGDIETRE